MRSFERLTGLGLALVFLSAGCGDSLVDNDYQGDPLITFQGQLEIAPTDRPNQTLQVTLVWNVEDTFDYKLNQNTEVVDNNIGHYSLSVLLPPPVEALNVDPETGGRIGFAWIMAYDDPLGEGPLDLSQVDPEHYADLIYRWRGGAPNIMLAYAEDAFPAGSRVADALGGAIEPGFYLVLFNGDCYCHPGTHGNCVDSQGEGCSRNQMEILPTDASVDLDIVDELTDFVMVPPPDWMFL